MNGAHLLSACKPSHLLVVRFQASGEDLEILSIRDFFWSGPEPTYKIHTISYRYEVTVIRETGLPDHALVSDFIQNGHWNLLPSRRMAGQCLMQEIALYELPQLPVEDRIVWSLSPDGN